MHPSSEQLLLRLAIEFACPITIFVVVALLGVRWQWRAPSFWAWLAAFTTSIVTLTRTYLMAVAHSERSLAVAFPVRTLEWKVRFFMYVAPSTCAALVFGALSSKSLGKRLVLSVMAWAALQFAAVVGYALLSMSPLE